MARVFRLRRDAGRVHGPGAFATLGSGGSPGAMWRSARAPGIDKTIAHDVMAVLYTVAGWIESNFPDGKPPAPARGNRGVRQDRAR